MIPENLYVLLADDRWYDPKLSIVLNHNDAPGFGNNPPPNWVWEKGQAKDFNFTLTFNRAMLCQPNPSPTAAFSSPILTPTPTRTLAPSLPFSPTPTYTPPPTVTLVPTSMPKPKVSPTFDFSFLTPSFFTSPTPTPKVPAFASSWPFSHTPTLTPRLASPPKVLNIKRRLIPSPTPPPHKLDLPPVPSNQQNVMAPTSTPVFLITPTPAPAWLSLLDKQQSVEFSDPPANIYVVFGDGPGKYKVEVLNSSGKRLEVIYERKIAAQSDTWLEWDCMDGKGMPAPPGQYFVVVYKDGKILKSLSVVRSPKTTR